MFDLESLKDLLEGIDLPPFEGSHDYDLDNLYAHFMEYGIDLSQFTPEEIGEALDFALSGDEVEQATKTVTEHSNLNGNDYNPSFTGDVNQEEIEKAQKIAEDNLYWEKRAEHAQDQANWNTKQAGKAIERGDFDKARDYERTASSWQSDANRFKNNIKR